MLSIPFIKRHIKAFPFLQIDSTVSSSLAGSDFFQAVKDSLEVSV
jgi:hypothetical protein